MENLRKWMDGLSPLIRPGSFNGVKSLRIFFDAGVAVANATATAPPVTRATTRGGSAS
jgi:hypothetical protein